MGRRGFAPAPTSIKLARGERRPSRVNYEEPAIEAPSSLAPPKDLDGVGLEEWNDQIQRLNDRGVLTAADMKAFEDYCRSLSHLRKYEAKLNEALLQPDGFEYAIRKGITNAVLKLRAQTSQLRQQCGLTPSSRTGVKAAKGQQAPKADPASRYLSALQTGKSA